MDLETSAFRAALEALVEVRHARARALSGFHAGARGPPDLARLASRARALGTPEPALAVREVLSSSSESEQPKLRTLLAALVEELGEQAAASARMRELALLGSGSVSVELERISLADAMRELPVCTERVRRAQLARGIDAATLGLEPAQAERVERRLEARSRLDLGAEAAWSALNGFDAAALASEAEGLLRQTRDAAMDLLGFRFRRARLGAGQSARHDFLFALELCDLREHLPPHLAQPLADELPRGLGFPPRAGGEIAVDAEPRAGRFPGLRVERFSSEQVAVVCAPLASPPDLERLAHGLGRALHLAHLEGDALDRLLPETSRVRASGMVLARPLGEPAWMQRALRLPARVAHELSQAFAIRALFALREAAARFLSARELESMGPSAELADRYRSRMNAATGVDWGQAGAFELDLPNAAAELSAFFLAERLGRALLEGFNEDWWRNPHANELLRAFWSPEAELESLLGASVSLGEMAKRYLERAG